MIIDLNTIDAINLGSTIFATGGGGDPYIGNLLAKATIEEYGPVQVIDPMDVPDDAWVVSIAYFGAPAVMTEKLLGLNESLTAFEHLCEYFGHPFYAVFPIEAGGINGITPIAVAAKKKLPIIDIDGMGRAFPRLEMVTFTIHNLLAGPLSIADEKGNKSIFVPISNHWGETILGAMVLPIGGLFALTCFPMQGWQMKKSAVMHSILRSYRLGERILNAKRSQRNPIDEIMDEVNGFKIIEGKITDVQRTIDGRWNTGVIYVTGLGVDSNRKVELKFQNEYLNVVEKGVSIATVPDMISLLDTQTGNAITADRLRYGLRITIIAFPCDSQWRTPRGLEIAGPTCFGLTSTFNPVENYFKKTYHKN